MTETEVERLVVRLTGDGSDYQKMLEEAQVNTRATAASVEAAAGRIEGITSSMTSFVGGAVAALSALGLGSWLKTGLGEWQNAESTALKLEAALKSNGRAVEATMASYRQMASQMQETTILGDDTVLAMLRQAEAFGITGAAAQQAIKNAIAMKAASDGTAEGAESLVRINVALAQGDIRRAMAMARQVPALARITDESKFLAEAQRLIATGMATAEAEAKGSAGAIKQLKNAYGDLMEEVGKTVAEVIAPVVDGAKKMVKWFQDLSPAVKEAIVVVALLTVGVIALFAAAILGAKIFNLLTGGVLLVLGVIVTLGAGVAGLVFSLGGVTEAWKKIKSTVSTVYDWLLPIFRAIGGYASAIWDQMKQTASAVWEWIVSAWEALKTFLSETFSSILGDSDITWESIRGAIAVATIFGEFIIRRFGSVCELVWAGIKLGWAQLTGTFIYFFRTVLPTVLNYFATNWREIFTDAFSLVTNGFRNLLGNVERIGRNIPRLLRGQGSLADIWTPLQTGFQRTAAQLVIPQRIIDANEQRLSQEFQAMGRNLTQDWETFRNQRLHEIFSEESPTNTPIVNNPMTPILDTAKKVTAEIQRWDAVSSRSAEAISRFAEYMERVRGGTMAGRTSSPTSVSPTTSPSIARQVASQPIAVENSRPAVDSNAQLAELARLLGVTNTILTAISARPGVNVVQGNLN